MVRCEECRCFGDDADERWVTYLIAEDEEEPDLIPYFASYCPSCSFREFGVIPRASYT